MTNLQRGLALASAHTKRTLPELVNTSGYWIAINAKAGLPFVTPEKIDIELWTIKTPVIGARGKPLKRKKFYRAGFSPQQRSEAAPLAALIIQARARPGSAYNDLTNNRYALAASPFKGVSREAGAARMAALIDKMIKQRHRSGHFLIAGWIPNIRTLAPLASQKFLRGGPSPLEGQRSYYGANLGEATPARPNLLLCICKIENHVGTQGPNAANFNRALILYGQPGLQSAVDREGKQQAQYGLQKAGAELKQLVDKHWK